MAVRGPAKTRDELERHNGEVDRSSRGLQGDPAPPPQDFQHCLGIGPKTLSRQGGGGMILDHDDPGGGNAGAAHIPGQRELFTAGKRG